MVRVLMAWSQFAPANPQKNKATGWMECAEPREKMGTEIRKQFCSQLGGLYQRSAEQKSFHMLFEDF